MMAKATVSTAVVVSRALVLAESLASSVISLNSGVWSATRPMVASVVTRVPLAQRMSSLILLKCWLRSGNMSPARSGAKVETAGVGV